MKIHPTIGMAIATTIAIPGVVIAVPVKPSMETTEAQIQKIRTGDFTLQVVDAQQHPIPNATIQIQQTRHHFAFGVALADYAFGVTIPPAQQARYQTIAKRLFNAAVHENALKWHHVEAKQGRPNYWYADRMLRWSEQNHLVMRGHTIFWDVDEWNQDWLKALNKNQMRQAVKQRAMEVCRRYGDRIGEFDVINEMLHGNFLRRNLGEEIVNDVVQWCHQANPNVRLFVNDYNIISGKDSDSALNRYVEQIRSLRDRGVKISGIGVQAHFLDNEPVDVARVKSALDKLAQFQLPIKLTEVSIEAPNDAVQAQRLKDLYRTAFAHPAVEGIYLWGFWEGAIWRSKAAWFRKDFSARSIVTAYENLVFRDWWTRHQTMSDSSGKLTTRAFFGEYQVRVQANGRSRTETIAFKPGDTGIKTIVVP